ncbi:hypothetical protein DSO57_1022254 [Entomophthora muscae]|uniref:Uncharacterized protein n=1 Tax=Entomophthora muscae TaxID=34485 RepID=A0ACC2UP28_9FUNG|nr:hypothetical protein DSO57_1022254 [Entomophthora muscae]
MKFTGPLSLPPLGNSRNSSSGTIIIEPVLQGLQLGGGAQSQKNSGGQALGLWGQRPAGIWVQGLNLALGPGSRSPGPPVPLLTVFCPPGVPFGPVHFTNYSLKFEYKDYTPEKILELDPLAHIQSAVRYNRQGPWIFSTPKLFRGKFNYLPAYNLPMEPPMTPKPIPASSPDLPTDHTGKLFGIVYITLKGGIDTIILAAGL